MVQKPQLYIRKKNCGGGESTIKRGRILNCKIALGNREEQIHEGVKEKEKKKKRSIQSICGVGCERGWQVS